MRCIPFYSAQCSPFIWFVDLFWINQWTIYHQFSMKSFVLLQNRISFACGWLLRNAFVCRICNFKTLSFNLILNQKFICLLKKACFGLFFSVFPLLHSFFSNCFVCVHNNFINLLFVVLQQWYGIVVHRCISVICSVCGYKCFLLFAKMLFSYAIPYCEQITDNAIFPWKPWIARHTRQIQFIFHCLSKVFHFAFDYWQQHCSKINSTKYLWNNNKTENDYLHIIHKLYNILRPIYLAYNWKLCILNAITINFHIKYFHAIYHIRLFFMWNGYWISLNESFLSIWCSFSVFLFISPLNVSLVVSQYLFLIATLLRWPLNTSGWDYPFIFAIINLWLFFCLYYY